MSTLGSTMAAPSTAAGETSVRLSTVPPSGVAVKILVVAIVFSVLSTIVVGLRIFVRVAIRRFGADDWLMCSGWAVVVCNTALAIWGVFYGLGMRESMLTHEQGVEAEKAVFAWDIAYGIAVTFVKSSICVALLRIAQRKRHQIALWAMVTVTTIMNISVVFAAIFGCQPISDNWDPRPGSFCGASPQHSGFVTLVYAEFAVYIAVDAGCVLVPFLILWPLQMKTSLKLSTAGVLGMGAVATIATIIRLPIALYFNHLTDRLYHRGNAIIWGLVELNLGIIAGSVPPLQKLLDFILGPRVASSGGRRSTPAARSVPGANNHNQNQNQNQFGLVTIGQMGRRPPASRRDEEELSLGETTHEPDPGHGDGLDSTTCLHLHADDDSTRRMIKTTDTQETAVVVVEAPPHRTSTEKK